MTAPVGPTPSEPTEAEVRAFLCKRPRFLAENQELYCALDPPARVHGDALADHMEARLRVAQGSAQSMAKHLRSTVANERAARRVNRRVQAAVVALIAAHSVVECIENEFPGLLEVDAATLCVEDCIGFGRRVPSGTVERLLAGRKVALRHQPQDAALLHAEAAALAVTDALILVPDSGRPTLLALACRNGSLHKIASVGTLTFLGCAVGAALAR